MKVPIIDPVLLRGWEVDILERLYRHRGGGVHWDVLTARHDRHSDDLAACANTAHARGWAARAHPNSNVYRITPFGSALLAAHRQRVKVYNAS